MMRLLRYLFPVCLLLMPLCAAAQDEVDNLEAATADIELRMLSFEEEVAQLYTVSMVQLKVDAEMPLTEPLLDAMSERLKSLNTALNSFNVRWNTYSQAQQVYVAESDSLLELVAKIQQIQQAVTDTLTLKQQQYEQLANFTKAEQVIFSKDSVYRRLYAKAAQFSLVSKLAPQLEKVKASEQLIFTEVQTSYNQAKEAAAVFPGLDLRMQTIEKKFVELKSVSESIQAMAYKPFIQRVKDYLLGLAAVGIIIMFLNLLYTKLKTAKQAYDQAKKLKESMMGQKDYPTI
jgi:hypothetical protein